MGFAADRMTVSVVTASTEQFLSLLNKKDISVTDICLLNPLTVRFSVVGKDCNLLLQLLEKRGFSYKIINRSGMKRSFRKAIHRPILLAGFTILLILTLYLPSRVLFVKIEGNTRVSADKILEVAETCGIRFGASRRCVRSEAIKNNILLQLPELKWAGVNTYGSVATITVRERDEDTFDARNGIVSDIVAVRDGVIDEIIVTRGTTALVPGQSICKGELLISGHSDCGRIVLEHRAEGEVYAFTKQEIQAIYLKPLPKKALKQKQPKNFSVLFGKKLINLRKDSGNLGTGYGKIYKMRYVYLPGGFQLPVGLVCVAYRNEASAADQLPVQTLVQRYIQQNMVAGSILREDIRVQEGDGFTILDCTYFCREMIGKEIVEEILLENEQRS